jgi:predicted permease
MIRWCRRLLSHVTSSFRRRRLDAELADEMRQHIELRRQALIDEGMDPAAASLEARRRFGNPAVLQEQARDEWGLPSLTSFLQDVRFGGRLIARHPGHALAIILTIALGAGLNGALSLVVNALFLRPPVLVDSEEVVRVDDGRPGIGLSYPDYVDYRDRAATAVNLAAVSGVRVKARLTSDAREAAHTVSSVIASGNYFDVLKVRPILGRTFDGREDLPPRGTPVVVLGEEYWERRFNRDPEILGKTIELNLQPFTVVGVVPASFRGIDQTGSARYVERIWIPLWTIALVNPGDTRLLGRDMWWGLQIVGRMQPGVTIAQTRDQLARVAADLDREYPQQRAARTPYTFAAAAIDTRIFTEETGLAVAAFGTATLLVLLIAAANVAGLLVARASARTREVAVRLSLGAGRARIIRQFLTESLILSIAGVSLGFGAGYVALDWMSTRASSNPIDLSLVPDARVFVYGFLLAAIVAAATGLAPAIQASKTALLPALKDSESPRRSRTRGAFVATQVAACLVFLVLTGLMLRAADRAQRLDPVIDVPNLLTLVDEDAALHGYEGSRRALLRTSMQQRIEQVPGIEAVALVNPLPFSSNRHGTTLRPADAPDSTSVQIYLSAVSPTFFDVAGLPLVRGRTFTPGALDEVVISQTLATRLFASADPLGRRLVSGDFDRSSHIVVGIVRDAPFTSLRDAREPFMFVPLKPFEGFLLARTVPPSSTVVREAETALRQLDSRLTYSVRPLGDGVEEEIAAAATQSRTAAAVAGLALVLSLIGIWGVAAQAVVQRTREIGVRIALGANAGATVRMVVRSTLVPVAIGASIGLILSWGLGSVLQSQLFGLRGHDPIAFAGAILVLVAAATIAAAIPARRAARVDPLVALRSE